MRRLSLLKCSQTYWSIDVEVCPALVSICVKFPLTPFRHFSLQFAIVFRLGQLWNNGFQPTRTRWRCYRGQQPGTRAPRRPPNFRHIEFRAFRRKSGKCFLISKGCARGSDYTGPERGGRRYVRWCCRKSRVGRTALLEDLVYSFSLVRLAGEYSVRLIHKWPCRIGRHRCKTLHSCSTGKEMKHRHSSFGGNTQRC